MSSKVQNKVPFSWIVLFLCGMNLFFMHGYMFLTSGLEWDPDFFVFFDNVFGVIFDVLVIFLLIYILSSLRFALCFCFGVTLLWSFANVLYSRFFQHYISLSAIGQGDALFNSQMLSIVIGGIRWIDLYFVFVLVLFLILWKQIEKIDKIKSRIALILLISFLVDLGGYFLWCSLSQDRRFLRFCTNVYSYYHFSEHFQSCNPQMAFFGRGSVYTLITDLYLLSQGTVELTEKQIQQIRTEQMKSRPDWENAQTSKKNIIIIIVESYMSFTSNMKVNDKEITPFLNSLRRDSTVYYNGEMSDNVTIGESSDGQFIYMTGILPLRSAITVSKTKGITLPGLPKRLGGDAQMIIPTTASMWNQDDMCRQYGFNHLYSNTDYNGEHDTYLNDEQVFQMAIQKDSHIKEPFLLVILTMSMHQPYIEQIDPTFFISDKSISSELACYLNACHYTDSQIRRYFQHLKLSELYDKSLIVIVADHPVHNTDFGGVSKNIPLYMINVPKEKRQKMREGKCNQIDLYTTLLDLVGAKGDWYGMGRSLLSPYYSPVIDEKQWNASEMIIRGDYFKNIE